MWDVLAKMREISQNAGFPCGTVDTYGDKVDVEGYMDKYQLTEYTAYGRKFRMTKKMAKV